MYLQIKVLPKSAKTEFLTLMEDGTLKIRLKAVPERGAANIELQRFLAEKCGVAKEEIRIVSGQSSQRKLLRLPEEADLSWMHAQS